jgi:type III secretion protein O
VEVLKDLLHIKLYREEKAELALARARFHLLDMEKALEKSRQALENHQRECEKKEKSMYQELCTRLVLVKEIDEVALDVKLMKEAATDLEKKIEEAKESRDQAAEAVEVSRQAHRDAVRMREKFMELVQTVDAERAVEVLRFEDLELEEAAGSRHASLKSQHTDFSDQEVGVA